MNENDKGHRVPANELYRNTKIIEYNRGGHPVFMARIKLKHRYTFFDLHFDCDVGLTPYDFVIRLLIAIIDTREIELIEIYQDQIYAESYEPKGGWFRKGEERPPFP